MLSLIFRWVTKLAKIKGLFYLYNSLYIYGFKMVSIFIYIYAHLFHNIYITRYHMALEGYFF